MTEGNRLKAQCDKILEYLTMKAFVTNTELAQIALKYTGRISDLRKRGYVIKCVLNRDTGVSVYRLVGKDQGPEQTSLFKKGMVDPG